MEGVDQIIIFFLLLLFLLSGNIGVSSISYDYSATTECLASPRSSQYGGGIIVNPEFDDGAAGWTLTGGAIREQVSEEGNRFLVAHGRTESSHSLQQTVELEDGKIYTFSAWIQTSAGRETVTALVKTRDGAVRPAGEVTAKKGCWSMLKGGIIATSSGPADVLFECKNPSTDVWVDSVSLQPFTAQQWRSHQKESAQKARKGNVKFHVTHKNGTSFDGARISIKQTRHGFPIGCGMNHHILTNIGYQNWFASRFKYATFTNEMKWYSTEVIRGVENYTITDQMLEFTKHHGILVRGHNVLWANQKMQPEWVKTLQPLELGIATMKRVRSVVTRYARQLIAWDVMNENVHFHFFEDLLGPYASPFFYSMTARLDPVPILFLNEYNTIENESDQVASPARYIERLEEMRAYVGNQKIKFGIGLEGHFGVGQVNLAYVRSALDTFATLGLPIWITELDNLPSPNQALYFEQILREVYSHPAVDGIIMFGGPIVAGFTNLTLADSNFHNTPMGDVADRLLKEQKFGASVTIVDSEGMQQVSVPLGDYIAEISHPSTDSTTRVTFKVAKDSGNDHIVHVALHS